MESIIFVAFASFCAGKDQPVRGNRTYQKPVHDDQVNDIPREGNDPGVEEYLNQRNLCPFKMHNWKDCQNYE